MVLQDYKIDGEYICISKKELEKMEEYYWEMMLEEFGKEDNGMGEHYAGKRDMVLDILKMFEPLMG